MNSPTLQTSDSLPPSIVVMGVCGCGKTTIGTMLGQAIQAEFIDGDALHPKENVEKMASGSPLNDEDRRPWLHKVGETLGQTKAPRIVACSALKRMYRQQISDAAKQPVFFVLLDGSKDQLTTRMKSREGHFMPPALLDSQLDTLEPPGAEEFAVIINADQPVETVFDAVLKSINAVSRPQASPTSFPQSEQTS